MTAFQVRSTFACICMMFDNHTLSFLFIIHEIFLFYMITNHQFFGLILILSLRLFHVRHTYENSMKFNDWLARRKIEKPEKMMRWNEETTQKQELREVYYKKEISTKCESFNKSIKIFAYRLTILLAHGLLGYLGWHGRRCCWELIANDLTKNNSLYAFAS